MTDKPVALVVDDVPGNIDLARDVLADRYDVLAAISGTAALKLLSREPVDLILLDVMMPELDGFEVCRRLKADARTARIPVIFLTALDSREDVIKGLELGAYYYLTKPVEPAHLLAVAAAASDAYAAYKTLRREGTRLLESFTLLEQGLFRFRTLDQARNLAVLAAKGCPDPERSVLGLTELLVNAVEHGNLGISYADKSRLNERGDWEREVERRLALPEYARRSATLQLAQDAQAVHILITDQGSGFDWQDYLEVDPARAFDTHGRGIAMAKALSFDRLEYLGRGNEVRVTLFKPAPPAAGTGGDDAHPQEN